MSMLSWCAAVQVDHTADLVEPRLDLVERCNRLGPGGFDEPDSAADGRLPEPPPLEDPALKSETDGEEAKHQYRTAAPRP